MTTEQANTYCYVFTGMSLKEFALQMIQDLNNNEKLELLENTGTCVNEQDLNK